ncbi:MAG: tetratricopeptide repeat protein, partial [Sandaracinaceae bacterium]|nr:tetratricopeptide repeat protein [Sandaracinaceae bacterium]
AEALLARAAMLESAADRPNAGADLRFRALLGAAELRAWARDLDGALALVERAYAINSDHLPLVRFARLLAAASGRIEEAEKWLEREIACARKNSKDQNREWVFLQALLVSMRIRRGNLASAQEAAREAFEAFPCLLTALLVLVAGGNPQTLFAGSRWLEHHLGGPLVRTIVFHALAQLDFTSFPSPSEAPLSPALILSWLLRSEKPSERARLWALLATKVGGELAHAALTLAACEGSASGSETEFLEPAVQKGRPLAIALGLEEAVRTQRSAQELARIEALAPHLRGGDRASWLARAALLSSADSERAEALIRAAVQAEPALGAIDAARERLAEVDPVKRLELAERIGPLPAAAQLAFDRGAVGLERSLFERVLEKEPLFSIVWIDTWAQSEDLDRVFEEHLGQREAHANEAGISFIRAFLGDPVAALEAYASAPSIATALVRTFFAQTPEEAALGWSDFASSAGITTWAALGIRESARAWLGLSPEHSFELLNALVPSLKGAWAIGILAAQRLGRPELIARAWERYAESVERPSERAFFWSRSSLWAIEAGESAQALRWLRHVDRLFPGDPFLEFLEPRLARRLGEALATQGLALRFAEPPLWVVFEAHRSIEFEDSSFAKEALANEAQGVVARWLQFLEERKKASVEAKGEEPWSSLRMAEERVDRSPEIQAKELFAFVPKLSAPEDRAALLRLSYMLSLAASPNEWLEREWLRHAASAIEADPRIARIAFGLGLALGADGVARDAGLAFSQFLQGADEKSSVAYHACVLTAYPSRELARQSLERLLVLESIAPDHPLLSEGIALLALESGEVEIASQAFERAARVAQYPRRKARLLLNAAEALEDMGVEASRLAEVLKRAAQVDITYPHLFEKLASVLEELEDKESLRFFVERAIESGLVSEPPWRLPLLQARLCEEGGDRMGARNALRKAIEAMAEAEGSQEHLAALRKLAELSLEDEDYRAAGESLVNLARYSRDPSELRWIFFELGTIYDKHVPDAKRAEAAYRRVLKLAPGDGEALARLVSLYRREGNIQQAVETLEELLKAEMDPDRARSHRLELARIYEESGDLRRAEQVLEATRRNHPTDLEAIRALADFYRRQQAHPALAMHLNRAAQDFRTALAKDWSDEAAWVGLVEVLLWRGRHDAASAVASAAVAAGIVNSEIGKLVNESGAAPPCRSRLDSPEVADAIAPPELPSATREFFSVLSPFLDRMYPYDLRSQRAERLSSRDALLSRLVQGIGQGLGSPELEVWVAPGSPRLCTNVATKPPQILVGRDLLAASQDELIFLLTRAGYLAKSGLGLLPRIPLSELGLIFASFASRLDPGLASSVDPSLLQEFSRRLQRHVPRKHFEDLAPLALEGWGAIGAEPARLVTAAFEMANRIALLFGGSVPGALSALARLAGLGLDPTERSISKMIGLSEVRSLLSFAISESHFEARRRAQGLS